MPFSGALCVWCDFVLDSYGKKLEYAFAIDDRVYRNFINVHPCDDKLSLVEFVERVEILNMIEFETGRLTNQYRPKAYLIGVLRGKTDYDIINHQKEMDQ